MTEFRTENGVLASLSVILTISDPLEYMSFYKHF